MKKSSLEKLNQPQLQSPVAILLILYKFFILVLKNAFPILLIVFINPNRQIDNFELYIVIGISLISATLSIASYFKFKYHLLDDEVIINKGILKKTNLNVPFDRIQAINTNQTLLHRIFKVASIEIDTAGSKNNEIKIDAIDLETASALKSFVLSQKSQVQKDNTVDAITDLEDEKTLLQLDIPAIIKVGFGENHFQSFMIIALFTFGLLQYADILFDRDQYSSIEEQVNTIVKSFIFILIPLAIIASLLLTLVRTVLKYYNLNFKETTQGYKLVSGLFTRHEKQANFQKIQLVGWHTNPLKKLFGMFQLNLSQAFSSSMVKAQTMQIPGMYAHQLQNVCESYFSSQERDDLLLHKVSAREMIRTFSKVGTAVGGIAIIKWIIPQFDISWLAIVLLLTLAIVYTYVSWTQWQVQVSRNGLLLRRGFLRTTYLLLRWEKIQGLRTRQSIFQKRHALTDLHIFTAAGTVKIPYLNEDSVDHLRDYLLYYVESNNEPWM